VNKLPLSIATHLLAIAVGMAIAVATYTITAKVKHYCDAENMVYLYQGNIAVVAYDPRCVDIDVPSWDG